MSENTDLLIHIGQPKTGTTTLQSFFKLNASFLKKNGVCFHLLDENHDRTYIEAALRREMYGKDGVDRVTALISKIAARRGCTHVLSDEALFIAPRLAGTVRDIVAGVSPTMSVKVVVYLRRQDQWLSSLHAANIKNPHVYTTEVHGRRLSQILTDFELFSIPEIPLDYYHIIEEWSRAFGAENLIVRVYEKEQLNGDIIEDFLRNVLKLTLTGECSVPGNQNISLPEVCTEILRICNDSGYFKKTEDMRQNQELFARIVLPRHRESRIFDLTPVQRRRILEKCAQSNAAIARKYLHRDDGILFHEPVGEARDAKGNSELKIEDIVQPLVFALGQQRNEIEAIKRQLFEIIRFLQAQTRTP
ncbi:MAG: hypothetical protein K9N62_02370 [Verrucomicrobia bacterium]|nr:hypothetical protein [Verrucomicrobiota bacterium]